MVPVRDRLDSLINESTDWQVVGADDDSLYLTTNEHGSVPMELQAKGQFATRTSLILATQVAHMVTMSGKIVDNDFYRKLEDGSTGPPIPGFVKAGSQTIYTGNGLFSMRVRYGPNVTLKAQSIVGEDTLSFESSHDLSALSNNNDVILHPVTFEGMEPGQGPLFKMLYYIVNDDDLNFGYFGKKYIDKNPSTHRIIIPLINERGDTMTVADQDSVETYLVSKYLPNIQRIPPIVKLGLNDTIPLGLGGGRMIILMRETGNNSAVVFDYNDDGIIDDSYALISKLGGSTFFWPAVAQEIFSGEAGPNNLNDTRLTNLTVLEGDSEGDTLYVFDKKLRRLGENYPPKEGIERILGNINMVPP